MGTTVAKRSTVARDADDFVLPALVPQDVAVNARGFAAWLPVVLRNVNQNARGM